MELDPTPAGRPPVPPWMLFAIPVLLLLGGACICANLAISAAGGLANLLHFDASGVQPTNLAQLVESGGSAAFQLGTDCSFVTIDGNIVRSDQQGSGEFTQQMPRKDAVFAVLDSVGSDLYLVRKGEISLEDGTLVTANRMDEERVSIHFSQEQAVESGQETRSIDGVVNGDELHASYTFYRSLSAVIEGQGIEEATSIAADFSCPLIWVERP